MEINESTNNASFGALLKATREKKKLKIATVANELFLKERQLDALENEDFDNLPQYAFTKGFALKYAKYLELDISDVTIKFDASFPENKKTQKTADIKAPLKPMGTLTRDHQKKINFNPWLILGVLAVIALAVFFIRVVNNAEKEQNTPTLLQESINIVEQQQGASIENEEGIPSSGSAINIE